MSGCSNPSGLRVSKAALSPLDALAAELGAVAGQIEREVSLRIDAILADVRRVDAERELRFAALERRVEEAIANIKNGEPGQSVTLDDVHPIVDQAVARAVQAIPPAAPGLPGKDADPDVVRAMVVEAVAALPPAVDGRDADPAEIQRMVAEAVAALPAPVNGKDADPEVIRSLVAEAVASLPPAEKGEPGEPGAPGKLPAVKAWEDRVYYEGEVAFLNGSTFQANRDTGRAPPHDDWICIAAAGRDGRSPVPRGTYADDGDYRELDWVAMNGATFVAKRDNPGPCPGDGWQMIAGQGKAGKPGERGPVGPKGERGEPGPAVASIDTDDEGLITVKNADGSIATCDLYPVLAQLAR